MGAPRDYPRVHYPSWFQFNTNIYNIGELLTAIELNNFNISFT